MANHRLIGIIYGLCRGVIDEDVTLSFQTPKLEPAPRSGVWLGRRHHGSDRAFFHRDGSQRIYRADCEHRLAGGQVERGRRL